jgi:predicted ATPase/class 3 adenylate cyclase
MSEHRALLLTDVVDSTQLAERLGDAAAAELGAAHDRAARDLLRQWRGREIDKTDGMLMLFERAADAAAYAAAYHAALASLPVPLKARAGLHVGSVILRANPPEDVAQGAKPLEVEGIAKPLAARVMSLALGGQTLLTAAARAALGTCAWRVQSHGHWRIKGIAEPMELFEIGDEDSAFLPPPDSAKVYRVVQRDEIWLPLRDVAHGLPAERDAFVGRQQALAALARHYEQGARLVSVLGVGGSGKTRLATRFAWTWLGDFPGGAWFCDLSAARGPEGIVQAVAHALAVPLGPEDPVQQIGHAIAGRGGCLIILDNFEQVARHAEATLGRWLDRAGEARFLVTTREVLGLPGETSLALPPLESSEAAALFVRRAAAARHDGVDGAEDRDAVAQLVRLLDGLPLAIELAAARVRVMAPRTLLARMDRRFQLLAAGGGRRDRQATLRATFDWSWELLSEAEKSALAQLSVFEGGFTLDAVEGVLDLSHCTGRPWPVDLLQSLVDKSFVRALEAGRFDLLSSVQDYAAEHLRSPGRFEGSGADAERAAQARHGAYFAASADPAADDARHGPELDNLGVACRRAALRGDATVAVATLEAAWSVLSQRGPFATGIELATAVASMPAVDAAAKARIDCVAGLALNAAGHADEASQHLQQALALARATRQPVIEAHALVALGDVHINQAQYAAGKALHEAALAVARACGLHAQSCAALNGLGSASLDLGLFDEAQAHYGAALQAARDAGDRRWEGWVLGNLGTLHYNAGAREQAMNHFSAALEISRSFGDRKGEGNMLCNLAALHEMHGQLPQALAAAREALQVARAIGHVRLECVVLCNLGLVSIGLRDWDAARTHLDDALVLARQLQDRRSEGLFLAYLGQLLARQGQLGQARECLDTGQRLLEQVSERYSLGLLLCRRAELEVLSGDRPAAAAALAAARALRAALEAGPESELGLSLGRAAAMLDAAAATSAGS